MTRRPWFHDHAEIRRRQADRLAGRPTPPLAEGGPVRFQTRVYNEHGDLVSEHGTEDRHASPLAGTFTLHEAGTGRVTEPIPFDADPHEWPEDWAPPPMDRSVHMRPAETQHPPAEVRRRDRAREWAGEAGAAAGELLGELIGWLVRRLLD